MFNPFNSKLPGTEQTGGAAKFGIVILLLNHLLDQHKIGVILKLR